MTTIRVAHRDRFVVIDQATVRDPRLSLRAMGLLVRLLSYPDNWRISSDAISRTTREGRDAVRRALAELEDAGYLTRTKCRVDTPTHKGLWKTELVLRESPGRSDDGFPGVGTPGVGTPGVGTPGVGNPGANRKTEKKDRVDENFATGITGVVGQSNTCTLCSGLGWVGFDEDTRTWQNKCSCVNASRRRRR